MPSIAVTPSLSIELEDSKFIPTTTVAPIRIPTTRPMSPSTRRHQELLRKRNVLGHPDIEQTVHANSNM